MRYKANKSKRKLKHDYIFSKYSDFKHNMSIARSRGDYKALTKLLAKRKRIKRYRRF